MGLSSARTMNQIDIILISLDRAVKPERHGPCYGLAALPGIKIM
jgi:hypothetical protein